MNGDDVITIQAYKANGTCYQWWDATATMANEHCVRLTMSKGMSYYDIKKGVHHAL